MKTFLAGVVILLATTLAAQEPRPLTLADAVGMALHDTPAMRMTAAGEQIARARLHEAQSAWLPMIQLSDTFTRSDNPVAVFAALLEQGRFGPQHFDPAFLNAPPRYDNYRVALNARYPLFDQFRRVSMIRQARVGVEQSTGQSDIARQQLRYETIRAFYGVLLAEAGKDVADQAVKTAESAVGSIRDRYDTGLVVESDLLAAEVQLADFRQQQIGAAGMLATARAGLNTLLDLPTVEARDLQGSLEPRTFPTEPVDQLIEAAVANRPDLQNGRLTAKAATMQVDIARGQFLPRVDLFGSFGASGNQWDQGNNDRTWGVMVSLNILEPGRLARLSQATGGRLAAEAARDQLTNQVAMEVVTAQQKFLTAAQRLELGRKSVEQAGEALRIVEDRYTQGLTTITERLRAQTALVAAQMNLLAARADYSVGYADLLRATGRLDDVEPFI